jgi:uncharacterized membrane protein
VITLVRQRGEPMRRIFQWFQSTFIVGLVTLLPIYVTIRVIVLLFNWVDHGVVELIKRFTDLHIPGAGVLSTVLVILVAGWLMRFVIIRQSSRRVESFFESIPLVRSVYTAVKQVIKPLLGAEDEPKAFKQVVTFEWPGNDMWVVGFLVKEQQTGAPPSPDDLVTVFLPTNHLHMGFVIVTHRKKLHPVDLTIEEALRTQLSLGVAAPDKLLSPILYDRPPSA